MYKWLLIVHITFFQSLNISDQAENSQNRSSILNETASITEAKVDGEVKSLLDDLKKRLERIRDKIRRVSGDLADVESNFPGFDDIASRIGKCCRICQV